MHTQTKLNLDKMLNLFPVLIPEDKREFNKIVQNAQSVCHSVLHSWEIENGSRYPNFLSFDRRQQLEYLMRMAYSCPEKWNEFVHIYFGEPNITGTIGDIKNFALRTIQRFPDVHIAEVIEVLATPHALAYEQFRYRNEKATHAEAMEYIATTHFHKYEVTEQGDRNKILGTWNILYTHTCACGDTYTEHSINNYSGD